MANGLMEVPDFVKRLAAKTERLFEDARSPGRAMPSTVSIKAQRFSLVENGERRPAPNPIELAFVVVAIKKPMPRAYYAGKFDPGADNYGPPDCYSLDGVTPETDSTEIQSQTGCRLCKQAEWGSKVDERGQETTACRQHKQLVIKIPGLSSLWLFNVPIGSVRKQWDKFATDIEAAGREEKAKYGFATLTLSTCVAACTFDEKTNGILNFRPLGYVGNPKLFSAKDCEELEAAIDSAAIPTMLWGPQGAEREKQYLEGPMKALPAAASNKPMLEVKTVRGDTPTPEKRSALPWNDDGYEPPGEVVEVGEEKPRSRGKKTVTPPIVTKVEQDTKSSSILKDLGFDDLDL
jgi:hypothetical protein